MIMENSCDYSFYGCYADEVYGLFENENLYYSAPEVSSINRSDLFYCQADFICNLTYYVEPSYVIFYPVIPVEYITYYSYEAYYVNLPLYSGYYVPHYSLPTSTYYVTDIYPVPFNESSLTYFAVDPNSSNYEEFDCVNGSYIDTYDLSDDRVGEESTTCDLFYEEYAEMLSDAPVDDEAKSVSSDEKLEENIVTIVADINDVTVLGQHNEQPYDVCANICDEDVDESVIKKVSLMSLAEVQQDVDETYEYGKANLYNEALKGYNENKCTLEELEWVCHSLDDIPEEDEPEDDSDDMEFNENILNYINLKEGLDKNKIPDVEDSSLFSSDSLSEESSLVSSQESLVDNCEIMVEENPLSIDSSVADENDKSDPILEHSLCEEKQYSGSINANQEDYPPVDSPVSEDRHEMISVPDVCSSREEIPSGTVSGSEEACPYMDSAVIEENCKMNSVQDLCLSKEKIDSVSLGNNEEPHLNVLSEDRGEETPVILEPAASEKKQRKKRFSSLRKFCARMCCCVKKPS